MKKLLSVLLILLGMAMAFIAEGQEQEVDITIRIAREFDVMLVQEIRDSSQEATPHHLDGINTMDDPEYAYVRSPRLGRTSGKEAYAFFYNTETVQFIADSAYVYDDSVDGEDDSEREPYIASFRSGSFDFTLVGVHTKPDDAGAGIAELADVVASVLQKNPEERNIIILGDLNADGRYFDEDSASGPLRAAQFQWVITNDMNTMTTTDWTYDRIVMMDATYSYEYVSDSAGVFRFDEA